MRRSSDNKSPQPNLENWEQHQKLIMEGVSKCQNGLEEVGQAEGLTSC